MTITIIVVTTLAWRAARERARREGGPKTRKDWRETHAGRRTGVPRTHQERACCAGGRLFSEREREREREAEAEEDKTHGRMEGGREGWRKRAGSALLTEMESEMERERAHTHTRKIQLLLLKAPHAFRV